MELWHRFRIHREIGFLHILEHEQRYFDEYRDRNLDYKLCDIGSHFNINIYRPRQSEEMKDFLICDLHRTGANITF